MIGATRSRLWSLVLVVVGVWPLAAVAGGSGFGDDDDNSDETGPSYFGFVRDSAGATVPDAKVTVRLKNRISIVTRTDALGTYKVPGFGKETDPQHVEVLCDKPGYRQLRVVRRSTTSTDPKIPIENPPLRGLPTRQLSLLRHREERSDEAIQSHSKILDCFVVLRAPRNDESRIGIFVEE